ncbi:MAG: hypothetical protein J4G05_08985 [Chlorobi bacterium]|nr:hypothetical protein [Chlorobiota bacterium]
MKAVCILIKFIKYNVLIIVLIIVFNACDIFPPKAYKISNNYYLVQRQSQKKIKYYLSYKTASVHGGGVVDGTVQEIGWNDSIIVVRRKALANVDMDGWIVIEVPTGKVSDPFPHDLICSVLDSLGCKDLKLLNVMEAWKSLQSHN